MSTKIDDGGPAFPTIEIPHRMDTPHPGMTLRDYFAAKAIDSNMREAVEWYSAGNNCDVYARAAAGAYRMADAMIAARGKATPDPVKSDLLAACKALRDIIHDDLTHVRQNDHAKEIDAADAAFAKAEKAGGAA